MGDEERVFVSMSEERRMRLTMESRTDQQLQALVESHPLPSVRVMAQRVLDTRWPKTCPKCGGTDILHLMNAIGSLTPTTASHFCRECGGRAIETSSSEGNQ